jgi:nicotinamidase-related amidase
MQTFCIFATTLLRYLGPPRFILTRLTGYTCVQITAMDACLRDYEIIVPSDCVASIEPKVNRAALDYMKRVLKCDTRPARNIDWRVAARDGKRTSG